jgi:hypothetical protein
MTAVKRLGKSCIPVWMPSLLMRLITQVTSLGTSSMLLKRFPRSGFFNFGNKSLSGGLSPPDCQDLLLMGQDERFWENIITGDETWCVAYDPVTKRQSAEWVGQNSPKSKKLRFKNSQKSKKLRFQNSPKPKKLRFKKPRVKTMLIVFSTQKV